MKITHALTSYINNTHIKYSKDFKKIGS